MNNELELLLAKVLHSGALSCEQYEELESEICSKINVIQLMDKQKFRKHLSACSDIVSSMPDYKQKCL